MILFFKDWVESSNIIFCDVVEVVISCCVLELFNILIRIYLMVDLLDVDNWNCKKRIRVVIILWGELYWIGLIEKFCVVVFIGFVRVV